MILQFSKRNFSQNSDAILSLIETLGTVDDFLRNHKQLYKYFEPTSFWTALFHIAFTFWQLFCFLFLSRNPFIQSKRLIIWIHTKTVNHITWNVTVFFPMCYSNVVLDVIPWNLSTISDPALSVYMSIQHIGFGFPFCIQFILSVITRNRIMTKYRISLIIVSSSYIFNPLKAWTVEVWILDIVVMVSPVSDIDVRSISEAKLVLFLTEFPPW